MNFPQIYESFAGHKCPAVARRFVAYDGQTPIAAVGLVEEPGRYRLFAAFSPEFRARFHTFAAKRIIATGARRAVDMIAALRGPVDAVAAAEFPESGPFLERMGFRKLDGRVYRFGGLTLREKVHVAERVMKAKGVPVEIPVKHYFSDGVYAREVRIPAGTLATGQIHKRTNLNILSAGEISVLTERGVERVSAPFTVISPPGTKRLAYAHTDCVWTTVHGTNERDLGKIEEEFIAQSEQEFLGYVRGLTQKEAA